MLENGVLTYLTVLVAAAIEGEVVFVAASVAVAAGRLNPWGVLVAGALGGAAGDQFFFYACRGRLARWLDRFPRIRRRGDALAALVRRHAVGLAASSRLLPGLRIAIPVACACANVSPLLFSTLNLVSAFIWSASIIGVIAWAGPNALTRIGIGGPALFIVPAIAVLAVFVWLRRVTLDGHARASGDAGDSGPREGGHYSGPPKGGHYVPSGEDS